MSKAYESIMRGLKEIEAHKNGTSELRTTVLEIEPTQETMWSKPSQEWPAVLRDCRAGSTAEESLSPVCGKRHFKMTFQSRD